MINRVANVDKGGAIFIGETTDVAGQHPDVVQRLLKIAEQARADLGDSLTKRPGAHVRPSGKWDG